METTNCGELPLVPAEFTGQDGLFIETFTVGDMKSGLGAVKAIPAADYTYNVDNLDIDATFSADFTSNNVKMKRTFGGYNSQYFTPYYHLMTKEQRLPELWSLFFSPRF